MMNTVYRLVAPRQFQIDYEDIDLNNTEIIVRPTYLSICHADQRYYQGLREANVLKEKLPMALLHEAIGEVVYDNTKTFKHGDRVVMLPNIPPYYDELIGENYMKGTKFRSSGYDGFLQEYISINKDRIIFVPDSIDNSVASFLELVSVAMQAIQRFEEKSHIKKEKLGIWGDGNLGYILSLILKNKYPKSKIVIFGRNTEKLMDFSFVDKTYLVNELPEDMAIDHAFECVGGSGSGLAINQAIDIIEPEGTISMLGVSEYEVGINTRMVLEKGVVLIGNSRSTYEDFKQGVEVLSNNPDLVEHLERLVSRVIEVSSLQEITNAFEEDIKKTYGKTVLKWNG